MLAKPVILKASELFKKFRNKQIREDALEGEVLLLFLEMGRELEKFDEVEYRRV